MSDEIRQRILAAFQEEHLEQLATIRKLTGNREGEPVRNPAVLDEIFRMAHSMKGGARVCDLEVVELMAHGLESLFSAVRQGRQSLGGEELRVMHRVLDTIEDYMAELAGAGAPQEPKDVIREIEELVKRGASAGRKADTTAPPQTILSPVNPSPDVASLSGPDRTVRINADQLDRLLHVSDRILAESRQQEELADDLRETAERVDALQRDSTRVRTEAATEFRELAVDVRYPKITAFVRHTETEIGLLRRELRELRQFQQRNSWALHQLGEEMEGDVQYARLAPVESVFEGFRKMMRDLATSTGKEVDFVFEGTGTQGDRVLLRALKDPVMHVLRNALAHGIETPAIREAAGKSTEGTVLLRVSVQGNKLLVEVTDDGQGLDLEQIRKQAVGNGLISGDDSRRLSGKEIAQLIFHPGFTTATEVTSIAGRGMGLSVVQETVTRLQGEVRAVQEPEGGTRILIKVPAQAGRHHLLMVRCRDHNFGIPLGNVEQVLRVDQTEIFQSDGRPNVRLGEENVRLESLAALLGIDDGAVLTRQGSLPVAVLRAGDLRTAIGVDEFLTECTTSLHTLPAPVDGIPYFSAGVLRENGEVALVLSPVELVRHRRSGGALHMQTVPVEPTDPRRSVLVVDDSFTTRSLEKSILEASGYRVRIAVDGMEGLRKLRAEPVDVVITDLQMPRMDGFTMLREIRQDKRLSEIPVILVTSMDSAEDKERGMNLGANAYVVKQQFDHENLLAALEQLF